MKWVCVPEKSSVQFHVKHLLLATVHGILSEFHATIAHDELDQLSTHLYFEGRVHTIHTGAKERDDYLLSDQFLQANHYPFIRFVADCAIVFAMKTEVITGDLTLRSRTRPVSLQVSMSKENDSLDAMDNFVLQFSGNIQRSLFDLHFKRMKSLSDRAVGDTIKVDGSLFFKVSDLNSDII